MAAIKEGMHLRDGTTLNEGSLSGTGKLTLVTKTSPGQTRTEDHHTSNKNVFTITNQMKTIWFNGQHCYKSPLRETHPKQQGSASTKILDVTSHTTRNRINSITQQTPPSPLITSNLPLKHQKEGTNIWTDT